MYWPDITHLREFYASAAGRLTQRSMRRSVHALWPELHGDTLLAIGYGLPLLSLWNEASLRNLYVAMPDRMGALYWPQRSENRVIMSDPTRMPLPSQSCNRIVLLHALEHSEPAEALLAECWRLLVPGGRLLVLVPNRHGIWARSTHSPFMHGKPYNMAQLKRALNEQQFTPTHQSTALHFIPSRARWLLKIAPIIERFIANFFPALGGMVVMEAEKQIYATRKKPSSGIKSPVRIIPPVTRPAMGKDI